MTAKLFHYSPLFSELRAEGLNNWANELENRCAALNTVSEHGDLAKWTTAWASLPECSSATIIPVDGRVTVTGEPQKSSNSTLRQTLMQFHPWRKGPFEIFGLHIDTEWRSDWKWQRLEGHVEFRNRSVLDVGCGNGFYGWHMLHAGARRVIGLEPFPLYVMQHEAIKRYTPEAPHFILPAGDDCLPGRLDAFDVTLSMGVLYHRSSPIDHLQALFRSLRPGGQLVLETLVLADKSHSVLVPEGRYAKMRNVWFIPSVSMLTLWLKRTGFQDVSVIDVTPTTINEQRSTDWMTFESLPNFLDPHDHTRTIEGYPGPVRALLSAHRPGRTRQLRR